MHPAGGGGGGDRGAPPMHGHARRGEASYGSGNQRHVGRFSREPANSRGVSVVDRQAPHLARSTTAKSKLRTAVEDVHGNVRPEFAEDVGERGPTDGIAVFAGEPAGSS